MGTTIRARFSHGVLEPLEQLDVPEGEDELKRNIYADRLISTRPEPRL